MEFFKDNIFDLFPDFNHRRIKVHRNASKCTVNVISRESYSRFWKMESIEEGGLQLWRLSISQQWIFDYGSRLPNASCPPLLSYHAVASFSNVVFTSTLKDHIIGGRVWRFGLITTLHQKGYPNFIVIKRSGLQLLASAKGRKIHENWNFLANRLTLEISS